MSETEDGVLWVVEVMRNDGAWEPAWDGEGTTPVRDNAEKWRLELHDDGEAARVVKYVRVSE